MCQEFDKGFGRIWAEAALERGDKVAATARNVESLQEFNEQYGDHVLTLALDVTDNAATLPRLIHHQPHPVQPSS